MVVSIVIALAICATFIVSVVLLCKYGITVHYNKQFTINDTRNQINLTEHQVQNLEDKLNNTPKTTDNPADSETVSAPMDAVIAEIQDLFGPEQPKDK